MLQLRNMFNAETTLGGFNEAGFQREKHLGIWVLLPPENLEVFKKNLSDVDADGFHLINRALILDVPIADAKSPDWEIKVKPITEELHKIAKMISQKGEIRMTTALVGTREKPIIAEFFSVKPISETDNVLMMMFVQLAKGFLPKNYRQVPVYSTDSGAFAPKFIGEVVGG
jgi:hypothetical protein